MIFSECECKVLLLGWTNSLPEGWNVQLKFLQDFIQLLLGCVAQTADFWLQGNHLICAADGANDNAGAKILPNISLMC